MSKKQSQKKTGKSEVDLTAAEASELEMILDRLSVQDPEGESLQPLLRSFRSSLAGRENLVLALMEKVGKNPTEVGFQTFMELRDLVESKNQVRMVKQTAYRFAQRGFVADREASPAEKVVVIQKELRLPVAHMVPADQDLWFIAAFIPESRFYQDSVSVAVFAENNLSRLTVREAEGPYKRHKELLQIITKSHAKPCEIPIWHAARLLNELAELCGESEPSTDLKRVMQLFDTYHDPRKNPYVYELMPVGEGAVSRLSDEDTHRLLNNVNYSPLLFRKEDLTPYKLKIDQIDKSVLTVPREVQEARIMDLTRSAADELCVGKTRLLYQRFLEELAMWLKLSSSKELAALAWRAALHLRSIEKAGESPIPVHLVYLSFRRHWPEHFEGHTEEPENPEPFQETESGLILPR